MFEFDNLFDSKPSNFCETWMKFKFNIDHVLTLHNHVNDFFMGYDCEVNYILKLLKLFPNKPKGRGNKRALLDFEKTASKMVVFAKVRPLKGGFK